MVVVDYQLTAIRIITWSLASVQYIQIFIIFESLDPIRPVSKRPRAFVTSMTYTSIEHVCDEDVSIQNFMNRSHSIHSNSLRFEWRYGLGVLEISHPSLLAALEEEMPGKFPERRASSVPSTSGLKWEYGFVWMCISKPGRLDEFTGQGSGAYKDPTEVLLEAKILNVITPKQPPEMAMQVCFNRCVLLCQLRKYLDF